MEICQNFASKFLGAHNFHILCWTKFIFGAKIDIGPKVLSAPFGPMLEALRSRSWTKNFHVKVF